MQKGDTNKPFRIGIWLIEPGLNRVSDGDHVVALESRLMDTLVCLASRPGKIVSADEMLDTVWHGRAHGDNSIYQAVAQLRKVLGEDVHHPRFIETIPKKGYRLICPVVPVVMDDELHATSGTGFGHRFVALTAGIALFAGAIILAVNPELRDRFAPEHARPGERSVAVLPFVDLSEDGSQQYLADGVAEELIHVLSNLPDLRVAARTSSFAFRDSNEDIRQIGNTLNVATILEGSIRKDGDRIRVTSQLVDARNGYHLWSKTFDRNSSDLFRIQSEIAAAVATTFEYQELDSLSIDDRAARPDELETYELYLLGLHYLHKKTQWGYKRAIEYFERAVETDPSFARAYAGLSVSFAGRSRYLDDPEMLNKAESAAEYSLVLDGQSTDAYVALGRVNMIKRDHSNAEAAFLKAIELNPNDIRAHNWLAETYHLAGRNDEAFVLMQKALELNPMSGETNALMGMIQNVRIGWDSAFEYFQLGMQRDPDDYHGYWHVGLHYWQAGQLDHAIPYLSKVMDLTSSTTTVSPSLGFLASTYVDIGNFESAAKMIRRMRKIDPDYAGTTNTEIHLQLARRNFSTARGLVHSMSSRRIGLDWVTSLMASYEMVIGDTDHAEEIYALIAGTPESPDMHGDVNLYRGNELVSGGLGAVNLAYLHRRSGESLAAQELLRKAREFINSKSDPLYAQGIQYVLAQIAAIEGNTDAAVENFQKAVDAGWTKAWFTRIDPIMADLRENAQFLRILEELEDRLMQMRERTEVLASNEP